MQFQPFKGYFYDAELSKKAQKKIEKTRPLPVILSVIFSLLEK